MEPPAFLSEIPFIPELLGYSATPQDTLNICYLPTPCSTVMNISCLTCQGISSTHPKGSQSVAALYQAFNSIGLPIDKRKMDLSWHQNYEKHHSMHDMMTHVILLKTCLFHCLPKAWVTSSRSGPSRPGAASGPHPSFGYVSQTAQPVTTLCTRDSICSIATPIGTSGPSGDLTVWYKRPSSISRGNAAELTELESGGYCCSSHASYRLLLEGRIRGRGIYNTCERQSQKNSKHGWPPVPVWNRARLGRVSCAGWDIMGS